MTASVPSLGRDEPPRGWIHLPDTPCLMTKLLPPFWTLLNLSLQFNLNLMAELLRWFSGVPHLMYRSSAFQKAPSEIIKRVWQRLVKTKLLVVESTSKHMLLDTCLKILPLVCVNGINVKTVFLMWLKSTTKIGSIWGNFHDHDSFKGFLRKHTMSCLNFKECSKGEVPSFTFEDWSRLDIRIRRGLVSFFSQ